MKLQHFFDPRTSTLTWAVHDEASRRAIVIDPVADFDPKSGRLWFESCEAVARHLEAHGLELSHVLETHAHADHLSGAPWLKRRFGAPVGIGAHITEVQALFRDVFPLYAATDIRGSSVQRSLAVQADLGVHLRLALDVVEAARAVRPLPVLDEIGYRIDRHARQLEQVMSSGDEVTVLAFLRQHVEPLLAQVADFGPAVRDRLGEYRAALEPGPMRHVFARQGNRIVPIPVASILRVQAQGDYAEIHAREGLFLIHVSLTDLLARLDPSLFLQVHRSHVVNLAAVAHIEPHDERRLSIRLRDGSVVVASRAASESLRRRAR